MSNLEVLQEKLFTNAKEAGKLLGEQMGLMKRTPQNYAVLSELEGTMLAIEIEMGLR